MGCAVRWGYGKSVEANTKDLNQNQHDLAQGKPQNDYYVRRQRRGHLSNMRRRGRSFLRDVKNCVRFALLLLRTWWEEQCCPCL